ncbi:HupE/UreJ family protein [Frankia sp. CH37]|nr:HupE/UreJ family protein [Parafrankia sp. CH37]
MILSGTIGLVLLASAQAASAHGIGAASETVEGFIPLGIKHMPLGWDHLLFVAGVLVLARRPRRAVETISLFAAGHSITLFAATVEAWRVNPTAVDIVVALSLVFVGVVGVVGQPRRWCWVAVAVFGFGLVHGLGLSTRLQDLGLPHDGSRAEGAGVQSGDRARAAPRDRRHDRRRPGDSPGPAAPARHPAGPRDPCGGHARRRRRGDAGDAVRTRQVYGTCVRSGGRSCWPGAHWTSSLARSLVETGRTVISGPCTKIRRFCAPRTRRVRLG